MDFVLILSSWLMLFVSCQQFWTFLTLEKSLSDALVNLGWRVVSLFHQKLWSLSNPGLFQFEKSDVADSISYVFISLYVASVMLLMEILYSCSHAASLLYSFLFSYSGSQNFSTFSLVGGPMMVIWFPRSSSKSFDYLLMKSFICWYCFCFLWYLESLLLRTHKCCLSVSTEIDLVCSSTIRYFIFIKVMFLFIFGEGLGLFICGILMILGQRSFIRWFILNVLSSFLLLMFRFLIMHSFSAPAVLIKVTAAA